MLGLNSICLAFLSLSVYSRVITKFWGCWQRILALGGASGPCGYQVSTCDMYMTLSGSCVLHSPALVSTGVGGLYVPVPVTPTVLASCPVTGYFYSQIALTWKITYVVTIAENLHCHLASGWQFVATFCAKYSPWPWYPFNCTCSPTSWGQKKIWLLPHFILLHSKNREHYISRICALSSKTSRHSSLLSQAT